LATPFAESLGPAGGNFRAIQARDTLRLFAGTEDGRLFRTQDGGESWQEISALPFAPSTIIEQLLVSANAVFLATRTIEGDGGLYRSDDGGASWTTLLKGFAVRSIAVDPQNPLKLYVGTDNRILLSRDGGQGWQITTFPFPDPQIESLLVDPHNATVVYAGSWQRAFRSLDSGKTWAAIHNGMAADSDVFSLASSPTQPGVIYAGTCGWVYRSANSGAIWQRINAGLNTKRFHKVIVTPSGTVFGGSDNGLYYLLPDSATWKQYGKLPLVIYDLSLIGDRFLYGATEGHGIFRLDIESMTLNWINGGMAASSPSALCWLDDRGELLAVGTRHQNSANRLYLYSTSTGGWTEITDPAVMGKDILCLARWENDLWAGTLNGLVRLHIESSALRTAGVLLGGKSVQALAPVISPEPGLAVGTSSGLLLLKPKPKGGFHTVPIEKFTGKSIRTIWSAPADPARLYIGTDQGVFFFSVKYGVWLEAGMKSAHSSIYALHGNPSGTLLLLATSTGLFMSEDGAISFAHLSRGLPNQGCLSVYAGPDFCAAGFPAGGYVGDTHATRWKKVDSQDKLKSPWCALLSPDNHVLYLGTDGHGLFRLRVE